ncbi:MAG: DUF1385 domain-containing protein [Chloroflexota bacterium]|nr:DUF1385 domain-containing protein [Chloroflexota bacterium]
MKFSYGGQAVIEGVMMRGQRQMAVAVRVPNGEIILKSEPLTSKIYTSKIMKWPFLRGLVLLWDTLVLGMQTLFFSANAALLDPKALTEEEQQRREKQVKSWSLWSNLTLALRSLVFLTLAEVEARPKFSPSAEDWTTWDNATEDYARWKAEAAEVEAQPLSNQPLKMEEEPISGWALWGTMAFSLGFAVVLFFLSPLLLSRLLKDTLHNEFLINFIEGILRLAVLVGYLWLISRMKDIQRVFQYHGAEHKTINAYEAGATLNPETVKLYSTVHTRCGTSFLLLVVLISILLFMLISLFGIPFWMTFLSRILLVPVLASIAYEYIKWSASRYSNPIVRAAMQPGLALQKLTTREPEAAMLQVSIASLERVLLADGLLTEAEWAARRRQLPVRPAPVRGELGAVA